jgi:hypothetical protein
VHHIRSEMMVPDLEFEGDIVSRRKQRIIPIGSQSHKAYSKQEWTRKRQAAEKGLVKSEGKSRESHITRACSFRSSSKV